MKDVFLTLALAVLMMYLVFQLVVAYLNSRCSRCKSRNLETIGYYTHHTEYGMFDEYDVTKFHRTGYVCNHCGFSKNKKRE